jgi:hypothetical protein
MSHFAGKVKMVAVLACAAVLFMMPWGCAMMGGGQQGTARSTEPAARTGPVPFYHDFTDVILPGELKVIDKESSIFRSPGFSTGILALEGRLDAGSLSTFFENNMAKDNWQLVSSFKYRPLMMLFEKGNRNCVIRINETPIKTNVEIWVATTMKENM